MQAAVRKGLTKAKILNEASTLLDQGGPSALTMRALAMRLGVAPMAVYNHFEDRDAILDAIAERVFEQLLQSATAATRAARGGAHWQRKLKKMVISAQQLAAQHPHIFRLSMSRPNKPASAFALAADAIRLLEQAGLSNAQALTAYHSFVILLQGYPFWREGLEQHGAGQAPGAAGDPCLPNTLLPVGWTQDRLFEAIVDWQLSCVADVARTRVATAGQ